MGGDEITRAAHHWYARWEGEWQSIDKSSCSLTSGGWPAPVSNSSQWKAERIAAEVRGKTSSSRNEVPDAHSRAISGSSSVSSDAPPVGRRVLSSHEVESSQVPMPLA